MQVREKVSPSSFVISVTSFVIADSVEISKEYTITVIVMNILSDTGIINIVNEWGIVRLVDWLQTDVNSVIIERENMW